MIIAILTAKGLRVKFVMSVVLMLHLWSLVEGKRARVKKRGRKKGNTNWTFGILFILGLFCLTFVPLIGYFLYNVWRDPLTPTLMKNGTDMLKEKTMGFLSKKKATDNGIEEKFD